ncbi:MAG: CHAT domain-containing protein [Armatimonadetes bacterium]|nr:CHAT domain-containing protein [Armatimonadota bacterium]
MKRLRAETYHQLGMTGIILAAFKKSLKDKRSEAFTAVAYYGKALSTYKEISHQVGYVDTGNDVCDLLLVIGLEDPADRKAFISVSRECVETARRIHYRKGLVTALFFAGKGAELLKDLEVARKAYEEAVTLLEELTRGMGLTVVGQETVRQETQELYKRLIDVLIREAFQVVERSKLQDLHRTVKLGSVVSPDPKLTGDLKEVETLTQRTGSVEKELALERSKPEDQQSKGRIEHLSQLLASTKADFYSTVNRIRTANPDFEKLVNIRPAEFAKIQKDIPAAALLVEYFPSDTQLYLFLVTRESFTIKSVPLKRDDLDNLVKRFRRFAARAPEGASPGELRKVSGDLYRALVSPIEKEVEACELLVIVPSGQLYYLPFQALAKEEGPYLVEKKQITYLTSSDLLSVVSQKTEAPGGGLIVAFGNPDGSLPAASDEVKTLKELFPDARIFLQKEATKEKVASLPSETRILHLATHGQFNHKDVNENYILFAGNGPEEASYLKQGEIYALRLQGVHLVTLSACQTALGDLNPGAEIASLAQAFSIAGTPSVLATLWSVADRSTAELMGEFYSGLKAGKTKAQALREAQVRLLRDPKYAHPFYWAPFILEGGW